MRVRMFLAAAATAAVSLASLPAHAEDWFGTAIGAVVGGVVGNQFGRGNGNVAATALGAAIGSRVGTDISRGMPSYGSYGSSYGYRDPVRYDTVDYRPGRGPWREPRYRDYDERVVYVTPPPVAADACSGETYYEGRYDPELARSYCRGRQEYLRQQRERELADARLRGLSGQ